MLRVAMGVGVTYATKKLSGNGGRIMNKFPEVMEREIRMDNYVECLPERADVLRAIPPQEVGSKPPEEMPEVWQQ